MTPFSTPYLMVADGWRCLLLATAFGHLVLLGWILSHSKMRKNKAWFWSCITTLVGALFIGYTQFDYLGDPADRSRIGLATLVSVARTLFLYHSHRILRSDHNTLFERARWELERDRLMEEHPRERT